MIAPVHPPGQLVGPASVGFQTQGPGGSRGLAVDGHVPQRPRVYRVTEGDNLWDIAARFLGGVTADDLQSAVDKVTAES